jgi:uncharacterized phage protein (TIGR01671 family)
MREIKFRAWDNKKKEWLLGYELKNLGGFSLFGELMLLGEWSSVLSTFLFSRNGYTSDDLIVMQFTGLKDKNGKEIYEGDYLVVWELGCDTDKFTYEVKWCGGEDYPAFDLVGWPNEEINGLSELVQSGDWEYEVIGNIYENPELVKVEGINSPHA